LHPSPFCALCVNPACAYNSAPCPRRSLLPHTSRCLPDMFHAAQRPIPWPGNWVTECLERTHSYWICTTRPDGRPHAAPVWGVWHDGAVLFSTDPSSRKAQNLKRNPVLTIHLESGAEVVILEGNIELIALNDEIDDAYHRKYTMRLSSFPGPVGLYQLKPRKVMAWRERDFIKSATKGQFI
jgi:hypothetical protein